MKFGTDRFYPKIALSRREAQHSFSRRTSDNLHNRSVVSDSPIKYTVAPVPQLSIPFHYSASKLSNSLIIKPKFLMPSVPDMTLGQFNYLLKVRERPFPSHIEAVLSPQRYGRSSSKATANLCPTSTVQLCLAVYRGRTGRVRSLS